MGRLSLLLFYFIMILFRVLHRKYEFRFYLKCPIILYLVSYAIKTTMIQILKYRQRRMIIAPQSIKEIDNLHLVRRQKKARTDGNDYYHKFIRIP